MNTTLQLCLLLYTVVVQILRFTDIFTLNATSHCLQTTCELDLFVVINKTPTSSNKRKVAIRLQHITRYSRQKCEALILVR